MTNNQWQAEPLRDGLFRYATASDVPDTGSGEPDMWPYPTIRRETWAPEGLRAAVMDRLYEVRPRRHVGVKLIEFEESGGYSEYTQESSFWHAIEVDGETVWECDRSWRESNGIVQLIAWLAEKPEPGSRPPGMTGG